MALEEPFYTNDANTERSLINKATLQLPKISTDLDSVRQYQWEVQIFPPELAGVGTAAFKEGFILGAKQVQGLGYSLKDIEVHRVNDKVFYPGKVEQEEVSVTFDNLLNYPLTEDLFKYLNNAYNMQTGFYRDANAIKGSMVVLEFDGAGNIKNQIELKGVYPKSYMKADKNYAQSEFDTLEVKFRYDFMNVISAEADLLGND